jgi:hypothetical protein
MTIEILADGEGFKDIELIVVAAGTPVRTWLAEQATHRGFGSSEVFLFLEDQEEPIELIDLAVDDSFKNRLHHLHRAKRVEVVVHYQHHAARRYFPPSSRVQKVLDWAVAVNEFHIDPAIAPEMELALEGTDTPLPKSAHIGRYAHHPHNEAKFTLIRGVIPNGAPT